MASASEKCPLVLKSASSQAFTGQQLEPLLQNFVSSLEDDPLDVSDIVTYRPTPPGFAVRHGLCALWACDEENGSRSHRNNDPAGGNEAVLVLFPSKSVADSFRDWLSHQNYNVELFSIPPQLFSDGSLVVSKNILECVLKSRSIADLQASLSSGSGVSIHYEGDSLTLSGSAWQLDLAGYQLKTQYASIRSAPNTPAKIPVAPVVPEKITSFLRRQPSFGAGAAYIHRTESIKSADRPRDRQPGVVHNTITESVSVKNRIHMFENPQDPPERTDYNRSSPKFIHDYKIPSTEKGESSNSGRTSPDSDVGEKTPSPIPGASSHSTDDDRSSISSDISETSEKSSEAAPSPEPEIPQCPVCLNPCQDAVDLKCKHAYCNECFEQHRANANYKPACPMCGVWYGEGTQPADGTMGIERRSDIRLPGFNYGTIIIKYKFPDGQQGPNHPKPGQSYTGVEWTAYLPDDYEGGLVFPMVQKAFEWRLVFKMTENGIKWHDIPHKTGTSGGPENYSYPDETYLLQLNQALAKHKIYRQGAEIRIKSITYGDTTT